MELLAALKAAEDKHLTLVFDARDGQRSQDRFDHPIAAAYDRIMFWEALALGYTPQPFKLIPVGGTILRQHFGDPNCEVAAADHDELAQLRQWLESISSTDHPREAPETGGRFSSADR